MRTLTIFVAVTLSAGLASAQSLGEVTRRDQKRRAELGKRARVLTNADFQRQRILEPAPGEAPPPATSSHAVPPGPPPAPLIAPNVPLWKVAEQPGFSLGEYARRLREQRAASSAESQVAAAPAASTPEAPPAQLSLGEYARRLRAARQPGGNDFQSAPRPDSILVRRGDSLWKLSSVHLGEGKLWVRLWKTNPQVRNPDLIYPGQLLRMPAAALARNADQATAKAKLSAGLFHRGGAENAEGTQRSALTETLPLLVALRSLRLCGESCGPSGNSRP